MSWANVTDILTAICLIVGATLCLAAAIGIVRLPDLLSRMHAGTKPQVLGVLVLLLGVGLQLDNPRDIGMLFVIATFQLLTSPVSAHMVGRAAYRTGNVRPELLIVDDLAPMVGSLANPPGDATNGDRTG